MVSKMTHLEAATFSKQDLLNTDLVVLAATLATRHQSTDLMVSNPNGYILIS